MTNKLELTEIIWKLWKLINVFTCVAAVRYAKTKVEVKVFEKASLEVMPLNHPKTVNWPVPHCELHAVVKKQTRCTEVYKRLMRQNVDYYAVSYVHSESYGLATYVAPTVRSFKKAGVNWYLTKRPALVSTSPLSSSPSIRPNPENMFLYYVSRIERLLQ